MPQNCPVLIWQLTDQMNRPATVTGRMEVYRGLADGKPIENNLYAQRSVQHSFNNQSCCTEIASYLDSHITLPDIQAICPMPPLEECDLWPRVTLYYLLWALPPS